MNVEILTANFSFLSKHGTLASWSLDNKAYFSLKSKKKHNIVN